MLFVWPRYRCCCRVVGRARNHVCRDRKTFKSSVTVICLTFYSSACVCWELPDVRDATERLLSSINMNLSLLDYCMCWCSQQTLVSGTLVKSLVSQIILTSIVSVELLIATELGISLFIPSSCPCHPKSRKLNLYIILYSMMTKQI